MFGGLIRPGISLSYGEMGSLAREVFNILKWVGVLAVLWFAYGATMSVQHDASFCDAHPYDSSCK